MWNKLYTNEGTVLEPLLKELKQLVAVRTKSKEIAELDIEIQRLNEQSRILNQVMMKGYMDSALFMEKGNHGLCGNGQQHSQKKRRKQRQKEPNCQPKQEKQQNYRGKFGITGAQEGISFLQKKYRGCFL